MIPGSRDSRGKESKTLTMVIGAYCVLLGKFALGGLTLGEFGTFPPISGHEFATAFIAILGAWLGREWQARETPR